MIPRDFGCEPNPSSMHMYATTLDLTSRRELNHSLTNWGLQRQRRRDKNWIRNLHSTLRGITNGLQATGYSSEWARKDISCHVIERCGAIPNNQIANKTNCVLVRMKHRAWGQAKLVNNSNDMSYQSCGRPTWSRTKNLCPPCNKYGLSYQTRRQSDERSSSEQQ